MDRHIQTVAPPTHRAVASGQTHHFGRRGRAAKPSPAASCAQAPATRAGARSTRRSAEPLDSADQSPSPASRRANFGLGMARPGTGAVALPRKSGNPNQRRATQWTILPNPRRAVAGWKQPTLKVQHATPRPPVDRLHGCCLRPALIPSGELHPARVEAPICRVRQRPRPGLQPSCQLRRWVSKHSRTGPQQTIVAGAIHSWQLRCMPLPCSVTNLLG